MTTTVWVRDNPQDEWRPALNDLPEKKAHKVSDRYNEKYDKEYYVSQPKPNPEVRL